MWWLVFSILAAVGILIFVPGLFALMRAGNRADRGENRITEILFMEQKPEAEETEEETEEEAKTMSITIES